MISALPNPMELSHLCHVYPTLRNIIPKSLLAITTFHTQPFFLSIIILFLLVLLLYLCLSIFLLSYSLYCLIHVNWDITFQNVSFKQKMMWKYVVSSIISIQSQIFFLLARIGQQCCCWLMNRMNNNNNNSKVPSNSNDWKMADRLGQLSVRSRCRFVCVCLVHTMTDQK
jgi:hypothetical protein